MTFVFFAPIWRPRSRSNKQTTSSSLPGCPRDRWGSGLRGAGKGTLRTCRTRRGANASKRDGGCRKAHGTLGRRHSEGVLNGLVLKGIHMHMIPPCFGGIGSLREVAPTRLTFRSVHPPPTTPALVETGPHWEFHRRPGPGPDLRPCDGATGFHPMSPTGFHTPCLPSKPCLVCKRTPGV